MQQRGIEPLVVELLCRYGAEEHDGRGAVRRYFDKGSRKLLRRAIGRQTYKRLEGFLDTYLVECDGKIITTGPRH